MEFYVGTRGGESVWIIISSRHERVAGLGPGEYARVKGIAGLGTGEVPLVLAGDNTVGVDALGRAADDLLEILAEICGLELRVQILCSVVAKILGVFGVVVAADSPRELVFGQVTRDELDRVEGVSFTSLSGRHDSAADGLLGHLCSGKEKRLVTCSFRADRVCATYVVPIDLLLAELLHEVVDLVLCGDQVVGEDLLVQGARVGDDHGHVATDIAQVGQSCGHVSVADNLVVTGCHGIVDTAGGETGVGQLVPPADIDDGIGNPELANLVVDNFFL